MFKQYSAPSTVTWAATTQKRSPLQELLINDQLKNIAQIEHSRHRSVFNFLVNLLAGLVAYTYQDKKPDLDIQPKGLPAQPAAVF